jgi:hypothetical protein
MSNMKAEEIERLQNIINSAWWLIYTSLAEALYDAGYRLVPPADSLKVALTLNEEDSKRLLANIEAIQKPPADSGENVCKCGHTLTDHRDGLRIEVETCLYCPCQKFETATPQPVEPEKHNCYHYSEQRCTLGGVCPRKPSNEHLCECFFSKTSKLLKHPPAPVPELREKVARKLMLRDGLNDDFYFDNKDIKGNEDYGQEIARYLAEAEQFIALLQPKSAEGEK